jgi:arylsulfatase A-like enzyme
VNAWEGLGAVPNGLCSSVNAALLGANPIMKFRLLAVALPFLAHAALWLTPAQGAERKPNFVFIYTDDQRYDAMSVVQREQGERGRFPWLQTPHMDRIAAEGVRFRNAFVTLALCAPSRAAFLTGRYNHANGVAGNRTPFPENNVTHATIMRSAGYKTAYIGKWHHGQQRGQRPGFDYSASYIGQGKYQDCVFEFNGEPKPTKGYVDDVSTDLAIDFIKQNRERPFSVIVGYKATHGPFEPPERAKNRYADAQPRPVPNLNVRAIYREADAAPAKTDKQPRFNLPYFQCISGIDDNVGRLLATLDETNLTNDTVIVFTSDNGYYHGEHGLGDKRSAYEESMRIPFVVRYPRAFPKGKLVDELVLNIDLAPAFLDIARLPVPREMQGKSWKPLVAGNNRGWRSSFLFEYFHENAFPTTPTLVAVRTANAKLIRYPGHDEWTELFDLAADPYEIKNLARDPAQKALLTRMTAELEKQIKETGYHIPEYADKPGDATPKAEKTGKAKKKG